MTKKNTITAALAVILATSMGGSAVAGTAYPSSTDEARTAAGQAQRSVSIVQSTRPASAASLTGLDEVRAAAGQAQDRIVSSRSIAERRLTVATSLDEARAAPGTAQGVESESDAREPVEQARAQGAAGSEGPF